LRAKALLSGYTPNPRLKPGVSDSRYECDKENDTNPRLQSVTTKKQKNMDVHTNPGLIPGD
jgi:hypothetical protein